MVSAQYFPAHEKYSTLTKFKHEDMKKIISRFSKGKVPRKGRKTFTKNNFNFTPTYLLGKTIVFLFSHLSQNVLHFFWHITSIFWHITSVFFHSLFIKKQKRKLKGRNSGKNVLSALNVQVMGNKTELLPFTNLIWKFNTPGHNVIS